MKNLIAIITLVILTSISLQAQRPSGRGKSGAKGKGVITGVVIEKESKEKLSYATVSLISYKSKKTITGGFTGQDGKFAITEVPYGKFYAEVKFIGFTKKRIDSIFITPKKYKVNLGSIFLDQDIQMTDDVLVTADANTVEFKIDRKIINLSNQLTAGSGSVVEALENVPSVDVDINGDVSLRGSSNFLVMIDGKPSILDAQDALKQYPASVVENIEIITNPSAKYDPDGTSGIINIITKKKKIEGFSGLSNLSVGQYDNYSGNVLFNYKNDGWNFYISGDYRKHAGPSINNSETITTSELMTSYYNTDGNSSRNFSGYNFRSGIDWAFSDSDLLSIEGSYGNRSMNFITDLNFQEWSNLDPDAIEYNSKDDFDRGGDHYGVNLNYNHDFNDDGHKLVSGLSYRSREAEEESLTENFNQDGLFSGILNTEDGPSERLRLSFDYTLPFADVYQIEAGYKTYISESEDITTLSNYDPEIKDYITDPKFNHSTKYDRNTHSLYTTFAGEISDFGYQLGVRGEYIGRNIDIRDIEETYEIDRWDVFPTFHFSYKMDDKNQMMASYTRRVDRVRGWYLEPFISWRDAKNVRQGNPDLQPQFIDAYEISYQRYFDIGMFSLEAYYRQTNDKIEHIRSIYEDDIVLTTFDNVGLDKSTGIEMLWNFRLFKIWNLNMITNVYNYEVESVIKGQDRFNSSFNWGLRFNNTLSLGKTTKFQFNARYSSPTVSSQGERDGFFSANIALRQDFFNKLMSLTLNARNLFMSGQGFTLNGDETLYQYTYRERKSPMISLQFSYNFNNYKPKRTKGGGDDMGDDEGY